LRLEILSSQNPGKQPHRCSRVSRVQRLPARLQPTQAVSRHAHGLSIHLHIRAERLHAIERAVAIHRRRKMPQLACAVRESRQHSVAMRDGFVPGRLEPARYCLHRMNNLFAHAKILPRTRTSPENAPPPLFSSFLFLSLPPLPSLPFSSLLLLCALRV